MSERNRDWLRSFLRLNARSHEGATVPKRDVERQEDTVLRALALLDEQPGVVLADEVGMGKTYEALGVIAARMHENASARTLILTPGPDLNTKWVKEVRAFSDADQQMYAGFDEQCTEAKTLAQLVEGLRTNRIVVAPVSIFAGSRAQVDKVFLLSAWAEGNDLAGNQTAAILRRYSDDAQRVDTDHTRFLGTFEPEVIKPAMREALRAHRRHGKPSLDAIWKEGTYDDFANTQRVDSALADLRFRVLGQLVPALDLLVVDEAHKLKNAQSVRATGVRTVFEGRFEKALFLTATPFQLTVDELRQVFALFSLARSAPPDLMDRAARLLEDVAAYTQTYDELDRVWRQLDGEGARDFESWFERDPSFAAEPNDASLRIVGGLARRLLSLKREKIEPGFRSWMVRSLREDKRSYRRSSRTRLQPRNGPGVPFLLYERFIAELFRSNARTHKAAVQINMVSSFGAAREGALLSDEVRTSLPPEAEGYRKMLRRVVGDLRDTRGGHPKVDHVVKDALAAASRGEKTLVFCARVETLHELKREIEAAWNDEMLKSWSRAYPGVPAEEIFDQTGDETRLRGLHSKLQVRFQSGRDALYLALRERYVATVLNASSFAQQNLPAIVERANEILGQQRLTKAHAERLDWSILKRCVEQSTAQISEGTDPGADVDPEALRRLRDPEFVRLGIDLEADDAESSSVGTFTPEWKVQIDDARLVVSQVHLWSHLTGPLVGVPADLRVRSVERLAGYLVSRYVPFLADLMAFAKAEGLDVSALEGRHLLPVVDRFWTTPAGRPWCDLLRSFLIYAGRLDVARRREVLDDTKAGAIVRHTVDGESRERLREAFNTPLYPMVLVANEVMQEGLDLHHHCRRVVHHDLAWNPAQLEQRVGRVDRLGSLVQRMRLKNPTTTLDIELPLIANTIDERLERTVRLRERWLEFLLGASPKIEEYGLADEPSVPLPEAFADALKVNLEP